MTVTSIVVVVGAYYRQNH